MASFAPDAKITGAARTNLNRFRNHDNSVSGLQWNSAFSAIFAALSRLTHRRCGKYPSFASSGTLVPIFRVEEFLCVPRIDSVATAWPLFSRRSGTLSERSRSRSDDAGAIRTSSTNIAQSEELK
jgi:hypothetical protein